MVREVESREKARWCLVSRKRLWADGKVRRRGRLLLGVGTCCWGDHCISVTSLPAEMEGLGHRRCPRRSDPITSQIGRQDGGSVASISGVEHRLGI